MARESSAALSFSSIGIAIVAAALAPILFAQTTSQSSPADDPQARFPLGPGRDTLFRVCSDCHSAESVLGHLKTHAEWSKTLDEMAENGALASDEEWTQILGYLDRHYSLIFINTATAQALRRCSTWTRPSPTPSFAGAANEAATKTSTS